MSKKVPKYKQEPAPNSKSTKNSASPDSYKKQKVCWQFSMMDFDFDHGWNHVVERFNFTIDIKKLILDEILFSGHDSEVYNYIDGLNPKEYKTLHDFFRLIPRNINLSQNDISIISKYVKNNYFWKYLYPTIKNFESILWEDLERETTGKQGKSKHHSCQVTDLSKEAQIRLEELNLDDQEELFSIRLTGPERLWGIRDNNCFKILWYDFDHQVYPVGRN